MSRREAMGAMVGGLTAGLAASAGRAEDARRKTTGLGVVIYCLGHRRRAEQARDPAADLFEPTAFLEYCHGLGAGGVQVPLGVREDAEAAAIAEKAAARGMFVEVIVSLPFDEADLDRFDGELRTAARAGAKAARTVIMPGRRYEQFGSAEEFREYERRGRRALELAAPVAARHRVPLAVENHKGQRVPERLELLEHIGSEWVGTCVDTGNSISLLEDPMEVVRSFAPWAHCVHLKDQAVGECDDGFLLADCPLGEGFLDLKGMVDCLRQAKPGVRFCLEMITRDPLRVPCLGEKYWATMRDVPARDLARTLRIVRTHARADLPRISHLSPAEQADVEEAGVRRCLAYAREELGL